MSDIPAIMPLQDKRVKDLKYIQIMYETEDGEHLLLHYMPKSAGLEENMLSVSGDGRGNKLLNLKFHFDDAEIQLVQLGNKE